MEISLMVLLFFGVMFVTLVIFVFWVIIAALRTVIRAITSLGNTPPKPQPVLMLTRCVNDRCRSTNAPHARFCRRCGAVMSDQRRYATPRLAS